MTEDIHRYVLSGIVVIHVDSIKKWIQMYMTISLERKEDFQGFVKFGLAERMLMEGHVRLKSWLTTANAVMSVVVETFRRKD